MIRLFTLFCVQSVFVILLIGGCQPTSNPSANPLIKKKPVPSLHSIGERTFLIVDQKPYFILGGELGNSTFTSVESMKPVWPALKAMQLNTVLAPVYWELIEPAQGQFDFVLLDQLIREARKNDLKLVLLWFGAWKNSMSSHAPAWIKTDTYTYPRIKDEQGNSHEILTPFDPKNLEADKAAFVALMSHLAVFDSTKRTVIMVQPENEVGMLPAARDHSAAANKAFEEQVPQQLIDFLVQNREQLLPETLKSWSANNFATSGSWEQVFGSGIATDEIFMAWHYGIYIEELISAGKQTYPLPMFVNAALNRPDRLPGTGYPSAGPLPHLLDFWKAAAPSIDFYAPDLYFSEITSWCERYTRKNNPLFIPEIRFDETVAPKALYTIGHFESLGFSPFSIESAADPETEELGKAYRLIRQLTPLIAQHRGTGKIEGVLLDREDPQMVIQLGNYELNVKHSFTLGYELGSKNDEWPTAGAIIIQSDENEFFVGGAGVVITFQHRSAANVGILKTEEGNFQEGKWKVFRHLNGDQTHQGRHIRIFRDQYSIQRFELYTYP